VLDGARYAIQWEVDKAAGGGEVCVYVDVVVRRYPDTPDALRLSATDSNLCHMNGRSNTKHVSCVI
jgi:hypothetical protein